MSASVEPARRPLERQSSKPLIDVEVMSKSLAKPTPLRRFSKEGPENKTFVTDKPPTADKRKMSKERGDQSEVRVSDEKANSVEPSSTRNGSKTCDNNGGGVEARPLLQRTKARRLSLKKGEPSTSGSGSGSSQEDAAEKSVLGEMSVVQKVVATQAAAALAAAEAVAAAAKIGDGSRIPRQTGAVRSGKEPIKQKTNPTPDLHSTDTNGAPAGDSATKDSSQKKKRRKSISSKPTKTGGSGDKSPASESKAKKTAAAVVEKKNSTSDDWKVTITAKEEIRVEKTADETAVVVTPKKQKKAAKSEEILDAPEEGKDKENERVLESSSSADSGDKHKNGKVLESSSSAESGETVKKSESPPPPPQPSKSAHPDSSSSGESLKTKQAQKKATPPPKKKPPAPKSKIAKRAPPPEKPTAVVAASAKSAVRDARSDPIPKPGMYPATRPPRNYRPLNVLPKAQQNGVEGSGGADVSLGKRSNGDAKTPPAEPPPLPAPAAEASIQMVIKDGPSEANNLVEAAPPGPVGTPSIAGQVMP